MINQELKKVNFDNTDFIKLCQCLEQEHIDVIKEQRSPKGNCLNNLDKFTTVFIQYIDDKPVGCLAMKDCINKTIEVGRLYVSPEYRQNKIATKLFQKAEEYAKELGANRIILDTYKRFTSAIALYKNKCFYEIDNYLEYSPYSICMEKKI